MMRATNRAKRDARESGDCAVKSLASPSPYRVTRWLCAIALLTMSAAACNEKVDQDVQEFCREWRAITYTHWEDCTKMGMELQKHLRKNQDIKLADAMESETVAPEVMACQEAAEFMAETCLNNAKVLEVFQLLNSMVENERLAGFRITVHAEEGQREMVLGSKQHPLPFVSGYGSASGVCPVGQICKSATISIEALTRSANGGYERYEDFNREVRLRSIPGEVHSSVHYVELFNGKAENVEVRMRFGFGPTRLWVEDIGIPSASDENTRLGGSMLTTVSEPFYFESPTIYAVQYNRERPTGWSPLLGNYVEILGQPGHDLVVTNVTGTGFFVTDLSRQSYNSLFIYSFSQPEDVEVGDRVCEVGGAVSEFNAFTQLQFPSWGIQGKQRSGADRRPNPEDEDGRLVEGEVVLVDCTPRYLENVDFQKVHCGDRLCGEGTLCVYTEDGASFACQAPVGAKRGGAECDADGQCQSGLCLRGKCGIPCEHSLTCPQGLECATVSRSGRAIKTCLLSETLTSPEPVRLNYGLISNLAAMEGLEGSLVTTEDVLLSDFFINCDDNGSGRIESRTPEATCRTQCNNQRGCTELSSLYGFDQWRGWVGNGEISVSSSQLVAGFDVLEGCVGPVLNEDLRITYTCPQRRLRRLSGNLRQVVPTCDPMVPCDPANESFVMFLIEPRFASDIIE